MAVAALLCRRLRPWEADGKSIVKDRSASWLEPCSVRVQGTTVTFYTTSLLLLIILFPPLLLHPNSPFSSWNSKFCPSLTMYDGISCVCVCVCLTLRTYEMERGDLMLCVLVSGSIGWWVDNMLQSISDHFQQPSALHVSTYLLLWHVWITKEM